MLVLRRFIILLSRRARRPCTRSRYEVIATDFMVQFIHVAEPENGLDVFIEARVVVLMYTIIGKVIRRELIGSCAQLER